MSLDRFKKSLENAPVISRGSYSYLVHPLTDGIPSIDPLLLSEVVEELADRISFERPIDKLVTIEAMGIPLTAVLSQKLHIPFTIIRKRLYHFTNEISVPQKTGYATNNLSINGLSADDEIVIIDDVLSTAGTLHAVLSALQNHNILVKKVFILVNKSEPPCTHTIIKNTEVESLICLRIKEGKVVIQ